MYINVDPFVANQLESLVFSRIDVLNQMIRDFSENLDKAPDNTYYQKAIANRTLDRDRLIEFHRDLKLAIRLSRL